MRTECYASTGQTCDDGQTCGHGLNQTQSELTSSAAGFPVRTFPTPDEGQDLKGSDQGCSLRPFAWFANCDPEQLCWKTWQRCLLGDWTEFLGRWPRSGMMQNGIAYRLRPLVPRISGTGFSLWPTPNSRDWKGEPGPGWSRQVSLPQAVRMWPTPTSREWKGGRKPETLKAAGRTPTNSLCDSVNHAEGSNGQLNPTWVEWLMGFPPGWTDCEDSETQ